MVFSSLSLFAYIQYFSSYSFVVVLSDSNAPSQYTGDVVFIDKTINPTNIKIDDIFIYKNPNHGITVIHRVFDIWITDNNEVYIAMKGDSNNQPDISDPLGNTIINKNVSYTLSDSDFSNPTTIDILVSYYLAKDVLLGEVIYQIPLIGWPILIPFFSPLSLLMSLYLLITIILGFSVILTMVYSANKKFKKIISSISLKRPISLQDKKIKSPSYFNFLIIPVILFISIFFFSTVQGTYSVEIFVLENDIDLNSINSGSIKWNETIELNGGSKSYTNISTITMFIENSSSEFIDFKIIELVSSKGNIIKDELFGTSDSFEDISNYNYIVKVINGSFEIVEILGNINPSRKMFGHHAFFLNLVPNSSNNPYPGFFVRDFFRFANEIDYNSENAWKSYNEFRGVQELVNFQVEEEAIISVDGILLDYKFRQSESLLLIPEMIFSVIPVLVFILTIKILHRKIKKEFDNKISILLDENRKKEEFSIDTLSDVNENFE
ncbi:MAG: signal peptidase I [Candidatus Hodarchaeales archaeon]